MHQRTDITWKIGGEAGFGIMSTGQIFATICSRAGFHVYDYVEYPSLIRGGHNTFHVKVSRDPVYAIPHTVDLLVALNKRTIEKHITEVTSGGAILYDNEKVMLDPSFMEGRDVHFLGVPLARLAKESGGEIIMQNSVAMGATVALLDFDFTVLADVLQKMFGRKGEQVVKVNLDTARAGFDFVKQHFADYTGAVLSLPDAIMERRMVLTGNDAIALGAIQAGCKFYVAYPMTPASSILHTMAANEEKYNIVVKHAEDEIAVMNMTIGASVAGARSMCATSGGGFALMVEALGLAGITEVPLVCVVSSRPGPATGLPTWTEQGDLKFVLSAAPGDFPRIVLAPGDTAEAFYETMRAFNLADKYQTPVIILSDKYLSENHMSTSFFDVRRVPLIREGLVRDAELAQAQGFKRYAVTDSGISARSIPGQIGGVYNANSDEHDELGLSSEDLAMRNAQMEKRARKLEHFWDDAVATGVPGPQLYGPADADVTLIGWGSVKGPVLEALRLLAAQGKKVNFLHYVYVWPFPVQQTKSFLTQTKKIVNIENNQSGQFGLLFRQEMLRDFDHHLLKYNGQQFFPGEIMERMLKEVF